MDTKSMSIEISLNKQTLTRLDPNKPTELSQGYLFIHIAKFDDTWSGLTRKLIVQYKNEPVEEVLFDSQGLVEVPIDVIRFPGFSISILGLDINGNVVITTPIKEIPVHKTVGVSGGVNYVKEIHSDTLDVNSVNGLVTVEIPGDNVKSVTYNEVTDGLDVVSIDGTFTFIYLGIKTSGSNLLIKVNSLDDLTPEFIEENLERLKTAMHLEIISRSRVYVKATGIVAPGTKFPFKLPAVFSVNIVFVHPNIKTGEHDYVKINQTDYSVEYN